MDELIAYLRGRIFDESRDSATVWSGRIADIISREERSVTSRTLAALHDMTQVEFFCYRLRQAGFCIYSVSISGDFLIASNSFGDFLIASNSFAKDSYVTAIIVQDVLDKYWFR